MNDLEQLKTVSEKLAAIDEDRARTSDERARLIVRLLDAGTRMLDVQIATGLSAARLRVIREKYVNG